MHLISWTEAKLEQNGPVNRDFANSEADEF